MASTIQKLVPRSLSVPARFLSQTSALRSDDGYDGKTKRKEWDLNKPEERELYKFYRPERITPNKRGIELLKTPGLNRVRGLSSTNYPAQFRDWRFR
jgi:hypothetical protein